jgi:hypothetical protein
MSVAYNTALADAAPFTPPESGLSRSVFVQQNTTYMQYDDMPLTYNFGSISYQCSVPDWVRVTMGCGMVFMSDDHYKYIHVTDSKANEINQTLNNELSYCIMSDADVTQTEFVTRASDKGFYNGYEMLYSAQEMTVKNSSGKSKTFYLLSYIIPVSGSDRCAVFTVAYTSSRFTDENMEFLSKWVLTYKEQEE